MKNVIGNTKHASFDCLNVYNAENSGLGYSEHKLTTFLKLNIHFSSIFWKLQKLIDVPKKCFFINNSNFFLHYRYLNWNDH